jgi:uncharacterized membrane-anchored protein YitT (DUF2179 family)
MNEKVSGLLKDAIATVVGCAAVAAALVIFTIPNNIAPGGVTGLATAVQYVLPLTTGAWAFIFNVPLFYAAFRKLGFHPLLKTAIATVLLSVLIDLFSLFLPGYTRNVLVASVFGGAMSGFGMGLLLVRGFSTGGTDLLSLLLSRRIHEVPVGRILLFVDGTVVLIAVLIFRDIDVAIYSAIAIFVSSKVVDSLMQGADYAKVIYVVTDNGQELADLLADATGRGVTMSPAIGSYTGKDKTMLTTVVRRGGISIALGIIKEHDPSAFVYVVDSTEVHGEGFKEIK